MAPASATYRIQEVKGKGLGLVAAKQLGGGDVVLTEEAFLKIKTFMILSGVVIMRRIRVDKLYYALDREGQKKYQALSPICASYPSEAEELKKMRESAANSEAAPTTSETAEEGLRQRNTHDADGSRTDADENSGACPSSSSTANSSTSLPMLPEPSGTQHMGVWDVNGLHYLDDADVRLNRWLHTVIFPTLLSVLTGSLWAYCWRGEYIRSILGACVLFFMMLGPICVKVLFAGSQALFLEAARLNHSCVPNCSWQIEGQKAILGGPPSNAVNQAADQALEPSDKVRLILRTTRPVAAGEELTIDYIPDLQHMDPSTRWDLLQQEYGFDCDCKQCKEAKKTRQAQAAAAAAAAAEQPSASRAPKPSTESTEEAEEIW